VALAFALLYPLAFVAIAVLRIGYPYELEWMEGGAVGHVRRILAGLPLYVEPSLEFTPFIYPPLYFHVSAWMARLVGPDFLALRLVSVLSSLGCLGLLFAIVRQRAGGWHVPTLAACLFAASYREGGAWLDVGRNDPLYLFLMLAGIWSLGRPGSPWLAGGLAGVGFALSALTKQSALFVALPVAVWLLIADWRRGAAFTAALAILVGGTTLWLEQTSGGWYLYYVFELPRHHPIIGQLLRGFWTAEFLGVYGLALAIAAFRFFRVPAGGWRAAGLDLVLIASMILTAYATKIRVGSFDNLILPAHLAASLGLGWGLAALLEFARELPEPRGRVVERFALLLVFATFTLTLYKPWQQLPPRADRAAGDQIVESLRGVEGDVWVPSHPYLAERSGKPGHAHELALTDVLRATETPQHARLMDSLRAALRERRWRVVVLDHVGWLRDEVQPFYDHQAQMFAEDEADRFWPMTGYRTRPDFVWIAKPEGGEVP
jgi:4-amino-4-deoxy-L-arabinose transferase-like glycosyltransferase